MYCAWKLTQLAYIRYKYFYAYILLSHMLCVELLKTRESCHKQYE